MNVFHNRLFAGAAAACLGLAGSSAIAQQPDPTQHSTPVEKRQTQDLNLQGMDGTYASPVRLNGETPQAYGNGTPAVNRAEPPSMARPGYAAPQRDQNGYGQQPPDDEGTAAPPYGPQSSNQPRGAYRQLALQQEQNGPPPDQAAPPPDQAASPPENEAAPQQQYQDQMERYQARQERYQDERARYEHDMRRYDIAAWRFTDYPRPFPYRYDDRLWRINLIEDPTHQLAQAPIEGPNGEWIGRIRNVDINAGGQPLRVEVALNRRVSVWISPGHFRYDPDDHVVYSDLTRDELWNYPGATVESSYWP